MADIKSLTKDFSEDIFREQTFSRPCLKGVTFSRITDSDNEFLTAPFTVEEVKEVVWECDGNKISGPDGFNIYF